MSVEQQTNTLLDEFESASAGLFELSNRCIKHFEQGLYGYSIAKPSRRMKSALAIDREVLVIVSTFKDQQQRTIKFVLQEIQESLGRLETTMAVILHCDPDGNSKLRNWGRDVGLSILPIYEGESLYSSENLERALCVELYSHDPFDVTGPVSDDANFYGRRDEAIELARKLQKGQIRSCLGVRKVGKTSILNRMLQEMQKAHNCTCVMIDCSRDDIWSLTASTLFDSIASTVERAVANDSNYAKLLVSTKDISLTEGRSKFERALKEVGRPFILVFDEVDYITPGSPTNKSWQQDFNIFWRNLRATYQEAAREGLIFSVLVAGVSAHWFTVESIDGVENAALSFVPEEYLSPMPLGASIAMLRKLGRIAGLQIDEPAAELIAKVAGNMPYWSRKCASYINRNIPVTERPCEIKRDRIEPMLAAFVREEGGAIAEVALRHLFRVYPVLSSATSLCHDGNGSQVSERNKRVLRRYGVIQDNSDSLSGHMMIAGFEALQESSSHPQDPVQTASEGLTLSLDEWAEELAIISRRRNVLEKKLRELTLNFIRYDSMLSGKLADLLGRIISITPQQQRAALSHLTADQAIAKMNWTDIVKLIGKEWSVFERLFGEKKAFLEHCDVINDRFDAHAKDADTADFALYRRSLKYIEDRLAKLQ
ncbi:ATP-binding protein [Azotobacter chroococcum]|uniref:AAA-like domain-containing protein n=1 Tax=Azotobacter chroococcum TaxID=353 RepID=UPI00103EC6CB|nr:ATP-binding protein [Azotobacter chroococcum]TBW37528.1 ATP-binding protein [Azotobacter chroococcum]